MAKASINFQKTQANSVAETTREFEADYLLPEEHRLENEYWNCGKSDSQIFQEELAKASRKGGRVPKEQNSLWEGVLNLNKEHTLKDVQRVAKHIEEKFNVICTRIAVHRDEGHINERGIVEYNLHAHLNFVSYKDGKQNWRRENIKDGFIQLQTDIAQILNMERGKSRKETLAVHLPPKQHRREAKQREAKEKEIVALKTENEALKYDFREYQQRITALENTSNEDKKEIHKLNNLVKKGNATIQELEKQLSEALQSKKALETIKDTPKEEKSDFRASEERYLRQNMILQKEIKQIKEENNKLEKEVEKLSWYKEKYREFCQTLQELTSFRNIEQAWGAVKAKFLPTQEAKREEKPKSAFKQLEEDIVQIHKENPDIKAEVEQKPLKGKELMDEVQRLNEQGKKNMEALKQEPEKPKENSFAQKYGRSRG
jgi:chromosome segregation ATPase